MAIPSAQVSQFARKLGTKRKRRKKNKEVRAQTGTKPLSMGPPPQATFGVPKQPPPPLSKRALDYEGLRAKGIHYHPNHLRRLWQSGKFPKPFKPSPRRLAWWEHEIDAWLEQKAAGATDQKISDQDQTITLKLSADQLAAVRELLGRELVVADGEPEPRLSKRKPQTRGKR